MAFSLAWCGNVLQTRAVVDTKQAKPRKMFANLTSQETPLLLLSNVLLRLEFIFQSLKPPFS